MRITLLGHASVLVEMDGATCLMDPVFYDPFEDGAVVSCPRRRVDLEQLPRVDTLIISHRHPDHFDLPSLSRLPRDVDAIVPADALIVYALRQLGFTRIHPVHPMAPIRSNAFELYPTRSALRSPQEFGLVFKDASGSFWNQVDSQLTMDTIDAVKHRFAGIDLLLAMYASQNFEYFDDRSTDFPYDVHRQNLQNVLRIAPRSVVPGAAGFRFCGDHAWLNRFLFPISRERFVADLDRLGFPGDAQVMNPGDIVDIEGGRVRHRPGASDIAVMLENDTAELRFDPTAPVPELVDPNPDGCSRAELQGIIDPFVRQQMTTYARSDGEGDQVVALYREHRVRYALAVVFAAGPPDWFSFEFGERAPPTVSRTAAPAADVVHRIAASALAGWITHAKSFFYVRAYSRRHDTCYLLSAAGTEVRLRRRPLPDLLMHYLLNVAAGSDLAAKHHVDRQIAALARPASAPGSLCYPAPGTRV